MPQQQNKIGAILALIGGALALIAFFLLPLFTFLFINISASQMATGYNGLATNSNVGLLWLGVIPPLIVAILGIVVLASTSRTSAPPYNPNYPPTNYGTPYPPPPVIATQPSGASRGTSVGIIVASIANLVLVVIFYAVINNPASYGTDSSNSSTYPYTTTYNPFGSVTPTSLLGSGFWIYVLAVIAMLVGGIVQLRSSSR